MGGTLLSYTLLFIQQVRIRQRLGTPNTWVLCLFVLCSLAGRFGVAFLGFSFNLEETPHVEHALLRPNWVNGTANGGSSQDMASRG